MSGSGYRNTEFDPADRTVIPAFRTFRAKGDSAENLNASFAACSTLVGCSYRNIEFHRLNIFFPVYLLVALPYRINSAYRLVLVRTTDGVRHTLLNRHKRLRYKFPQLHLKLLRFDHSAPQHHSGPAVGG